MRKKFFGRSLDFPINFCVEGSFGKHNTSQTGGDSKDGKRSQLQSTRCPTSPRSPGSTEIRDRSRARHSNSPGWLLRQHDHAGYRPHRGQHHPAPGPNRRAKLGRQPKQLEINRKRAARMSSCSFFSTTDQLTHTSYFRCSSSNFPGSCGISDVSFLRADVRSIDFSLCRTRCSPLFADVQ